MNEVVRSAFSLGELFDTVDWICERRDARYLSILRSKKTKSTMPKKASKKKQVTPERLMQFGFAYAPPLIIGAAVSNKVFDTLETGGKTVEQVSKTTGASQRGLRAIMNALVGLELLKKDRHEKYSLVPESEAFLVSNKPGTLSGFFAMACTHLVPDWLHLTDAVKTGIPPVAVNREATGPEFFSVLVENIIPMSYPAAMALGQSLGLDVGETIGHTKLLRNAFGCRNHRRPILCRDAHER